MSFVSSPILPREYVSVKSFGAQGDWDFGTQTGTDDRAAIIAALDYAMDRGYTLVFPPGTYRISKYIPILGAHNLTIAGSGLSAVSFPSDDTGIPTDAIATSAANAQSAFFMINCQKVTFERMSFYGQDDPNIDNNQGSGIYARYSRDTSVIDCNIVNGYSLFVQDAQGNQTGAGDSITVAADICTLVDAAGGFEPGMGRQTITIAGASNEANNGHFEILEYVSDTTITYRNEAGITETSSFAWEVTNGDRFTRIRGGRSRNCRGSMRGGISVDISNHTFTHPNTVDVTGVGDRFNISGTTVTLSDVSNKIKKSHLGKYIKIAGSTSAANDGLYRITGVTEAGIYSAATLTYENASGVAEAYSGKWWIQCGEKTGIGAGATALAKSGSTMTLTANEDAFDPSDVGKIVRILNPTSAGNAGVFVITAYVSATQIQFENASGVAETFAQGWTIDGWDRAGDNGSSHAIYIFAGRSDYKIHHCTFEYIRENSIKVSGSSLPISDINASHNTFIECGTVIVWGADDGQEHNNLSFTDNHIIDCATQREGFFVGPAIQILGSRNVSLSRNRIYYSRNSIGSVDNRGVAGLSIFGVSRYLAGRSQPVEFVDICDNTASCDPDATTGSGDIMPRCISCTDVGIRAHYRTGGTLTKQTTGNITMSVTAASGTFTRSAGSFITDGFAVGDSFVTTGYTNAGNNTTKVIATVSALVVTVTSVAGLVDEAGTGNETATNGLMTLTDSSAFFSSQLATRSMALVNSASSNDGTFVIKEVTSSTVLKYVNTAGTGGGVSAGTYRIFPEAYTEWSNFYHAGGSLRILRNTFDNIAPITIDISTNVAPEVAHNVINQGAFYFNGDVAPRLYGNRSISANTANATIRLNSGTSWPSLHDNLHTNTNALGRNLGLRDMMAIGVDSATVVDFPLCGKYGRVRPSNAYQEAVVAYGAGHVDGDTIEVSGTTYTYKASSPTGNQFNSFAGLVALIDAKSGYDCADYGSGFSAGSVTTNHMRIRRNVQSASDDGTLYVRVKVLNPTALVMLRNTHTSTPFCYGRGSGSAGPIGDKTVVWSMHASYTSAIQLIPDNEAARLILGSGAPAAGLITCTTKANYVDTDYMTLGDGLTPAKVYEFDTAGDGVTAGRVQVNISASTSAADVAAVLKTAIEANQPAFTVTDNANGTLTITHKVYGAVGNVTMTENVTNAGHTVAGMSNGSSGGSYVVKASTDAGSCAVIQHAKSSNQAGTDLGAEFRFIIAS